MAKIPIILEPGRADGKLAITNALFDENKNMFQSEINDIQDTLNSDNRNKPLSANQGKILKELLDAKVIEAGSVPIDTEPTEGNTTHVVNSDGLAKEFNKCNTSIINTNRIANGAVQSNNINNTAFDDTLSTSRKLADAKIVGYKFTEQESKLTELKQEVKEKASKKDLLYVEQKVGRKIEVSYSSTYQNNVLQNIIPVGTVVKNIDPIFSTGLYFYYGSGDTDYELVNNVPYILQHDIIKIRNREILGTGNVFLESELLIQEKWGFHININQYNNKLESYNSTSSAIMSIPTYLRISGLNVTYLLSDGWHTKIFLGIDVNDWNNLDNWKEVLNENIIQNYIFCSESYLQSDINYFIPGYYINNNGKQISVGSERNWWCTDYIPIISSKRIFVNRLYSNKYDVAAYCFYDKNKNFISSSPTATTDTWYDKVYLKNIPENTAYIRCTTKGTHNSAFVEIRYNLKDSLDKENNLQEQIDDINININKIEQLNDITFEGILLDKLADLSEITNSGFIMTGSHTIGSNPVWKWGKIPIPFGSKTITFNNLPSAQYQGAVCSYFIDKNNNFISELNGDDYFGAGIVTKNIPSNAVGLMFTAVTSELPNYDIKIHINQASLVEQTQQNKTNIEQLQQEIQVQIEILIPDLIYAIEGTELNIWNDAVSLSIDNGLYSPRNYVVEWICNKGLVTNRCFRFVPTNSDVGIHSCTCSIYSSSTHNLIATKTFQIKVVSKNALNSQKRIVHFGDSLGSSTAKKLYENFNNIDKFTGVVPIMLGTRGTTPHYEAVGGYTWSSYATEGAYQYRIQVTGVTSINVGAVYSYNDEQYNIREVNIVDGIGNLLLERTYGVAGSIDGISSGVITRVSGSGDDTVNFTNCVREPNNPVWDSDLGRLNFAKYRERLGLNSSEKIDAATFQFGVNESFGTPNLTTILDNNILPLYNAFMADNPNGKFIVGMTTSAGNDVNGSGSNYGASRNTWKYLVNTYNFRKMYLDELQNQYPNLIIAPSQLEVDRYYGYSFSSRQISQRTTTTEQYHNNFVHPHSDGYGQLADALFATYVGVLSE